MIAKIKRGSGFRGALNYALNEGPKAIEGKEAVLIGGNMTGTTAKELAAEFKQCRKLRPEVSRSVWTESLRPEGTVDLTPEQWNKLATGHMKAIGLDPDTHMHTIFQHPQENHIHIVASRIAIDGDLYLGRNEHLIASKDCRRIEKEYGLQQLPEKPTLDKKHLTKNEIEMKRITGEVPPREKLQGIIDKSLADRPTAPVFEKRLGDAGVSFKKSTGGYSYAIDNIPFKGSQLGKAYSYANLQRRFGIEIEKPVVQEQPKSVDQVQPIIKPEPLPAVLEVKIKLPTTIPQDIVIQSPPPKIDISPTAETKTERIQEVIQAPDTTRRGDPDQLQAISRDTTYSESEQNRSSIHQPVLPELQSFKPSPDPDPPAPAFTAAELAYHAVLRRIAAIDEIFVSLFKALEAKTLLGGLEKYNDRTDQLEAEINRLIAPYPGTVIVPSYDETPLIINGQPITEIVEGLPPEPETEQKQKPAPTQGITRTGGRK